MFWLVATAFLHHITTIVLVKAHLEPRTDSWVNVKLFGISCQFISLSQIWRFSETICFFLRNSLVWRHCRLLFVNESHDKELNLVDRWPHESQLCVGGRWFGSHYYAICESVRSDSLHLDASWTPCTWWNAHSLAEFSIRNSHTCYTHIWETRAHEHITRIFHKHVCDVMTRIGMIQKKV